MALLVIAAAGYLGLAALLFFVQRRLLFPAPAPRPVVAPAGARLLELPGGASPVPVLWQPPAPDQPVVVVFHGNGEQLADAPDTLVHFRQLGLGVLAVEFPGYGLARAQPPSERALEAAGELALRYLGSELRIPRERVVLLGRSLGSGVAVELARRGFGARLVLISAYTSIPDVAQGAFPWLPVGWLARDRFASLEKAPSVSQPVLLLHGEADAVVPFRLGQRLAQAFPHATFVALPATGHNDVFDRHPELYSEIAAFARGISAPAP